MLTHQRLPDCHQTVQEVSGSSVGVPAVYAVSSISSSQSPVYQSTSSSQLSSSSSSYSTICGSVSFYEITFSMRAAASESSDRSKLSSAATTASDFLALASLPASAASLQCVHKASARCENFQLLPMPSPSAPVEPLAANTDANSLEVRPEVSASKIPRVFSCRKSLLISAFEAFSAWPTFEYYKVNRRVQCLKVSP